jgi:ribonuclease D
MKALVMSRINSVEQLKTESIEQAGQFTMITAKQSSGLELFDRMEVSDITLVIDNATLILARKHLSVTTVLGFDTESKPIFVKGHKCKGPHLIQLATLDQAFLFHHTYTEGMDYALEILGSSVVKKIGAGLGGDRKLLFKKYQCDLVNTIDLSSIVQPLCDWSDTRRGRFGPQSLAATFLNKKLSKPKRAQFSNWAIMPFSESQIRYAGNDAYVVLYIWKQLEGKISKLKVNDRA